MPTDVTTAAAERLRGLCGGAVRLPGDPGYDDARVPWNVTVDARPAAVAYPAFPDEVAEVLRAAADAGLRVVVQGTGHAAAAVEEHLSGAVLLRTAAMTGVSVDAARRSARVGAGVVWSELVDRAAPAGLTGRHMSSPGVGVVGSSLGGGISWFGREHGLQCTAVTAVELVLADGTVVRADEDEHPDLLWAARGGGGGFGVVTAMELDLLPISTVYAGITAWDAEHADAVLRAWTAWCATAPERVTTCLRLVTTAEAPPVPEPLRGRDLVLLDGAVLGDLDTAPEVLAPLHVRPPLLDTFGVLPAAALPRLHLDPEDPTPGFITSALVHDLPDAAIDALVPTAWPDARHGMQMVELRQLGGALSRPSPRPAALDRLEGGYLVLGIGARPDPADWPQMQEVARSVVEAVAPWRSGAYLPMTDDEQAAAPGWGPSVYDRLREIRRAADPHGLLVMPHV